MNNWWQNIEFVNPWVLYLLLLIPLIAAWYWYRLRGRNSKLTISSIETIKELKTLRSRLYPYLPLLRLLSAIGLVIALARPQLSLKEEEVKAEGIDIVLIMDISSSMLAQDFQPNRLEVSKAVAKEFIDKRIYDRIGLVVFAGESFTQCPLTTDHRVVKDFLDQLQCGLLDDGTAIGMGLASAVNRMKDSKSKSKVIILLTDGVNNSGYIKPITAAEIAVELETKVYTIGVGSRGQALSPVSRRSDGRYIFGMANVEIDERLLNEIAELTDGKYYRATDEASLEAIYSEIDKLEKTEMEVSTFKRYSEEFRPFLIFGLSLLLLEVLLRLSVFKTLP
ncbi:MAG: Ca-activated chloride channel family protein [Saprospiraceae bacterium]|jgi:Ca-activated chloride channel family protein